MYTVVPPTSMSSDQEVSLKHFKMTSANNLTKLGLDWAFWYNLHLFIFSTGKGNRHPVLDSEVVLTKMKLLNNFHEKFLKADETTVSLKPCCKQEFIKASKMNSQPGEKSSGLQTDCSSDYIPAIFSDSQPLRLYQFESEDSGMELASGANSPSTPSASEQSFVVHSRESSCDSKSDCTSIPYTDNSETIQTPDLVDTRLAVTTQELHPEEHSSSTRDMKKGDTMDKHQMKSLGSSPEDVKKVSEKLIAVTGRSCFKHTRQCGKERTERTSNQFEPELLNIESLEEYMDHCCRMSEVRWQPYVICFINQFTNISIFSYASVFLLLELLKLIMLKHMNAHTGRWKPLLSSNFIVFPEVFVSLPLKK